MELSVSPDATTWTPLACAGWVELTGALAPAIRLAEAAAEIRDGTPVEGTLPCAGAGRLWLSTRPLGAATATSGRGTAAARAGGLSRRRMMSALHRGAEAGMMEGMETRADRRAGDRARERMV